MREKHEVRHLIPRLPPSSQDLRCCHLALLSCLLSPQALAITPSRSLGPWSGNRAPTAPSLRYCSIPLVSLHSSIAWYATPSLNSPQLKFAMVSCWGLADTVLFCGEDFGWIVHLHIQQMLAEGLLCAWHFARLRIQWGAGQAKSLQPWSLVREPENEELSKWLNHRLP